MTSWHKSTRYAKNVLYCFAEFTELEMSREECFHNNIDSCTKRHLRREYFLLNRFTNLSETFNNK